MEIFEQQLATWLEEISSEQPCGVDIREDAKFQNQYYDLRECIESLREKENESILNEERFTYDQKWRSVLQTALDLLQNATKDIEVLSWIIEALLRIEGLAGISKGLELCNLCVKKYSDAIYPLIDPSDPYGKFTAIAGLIGDNAPGFLIAPLNLTPLIALDQEAISYWDIYQTENKTDFYEKLDRMPKAILEIFVKEYEQLKISTSAIEQTITECYGHNTPSFKYLKQYLKDTELFYNRATTALNELPKAVIQQPSATADAVLVSEKEEAILSLKKAINYFETKEAHSPVFVLLKKALRWSGLEIEEIFSEMKLFPNNEDDPVQALGLRFLM